MSDHQELDRQSADSRRDRARMLLDQAAEVDNNEELKRKLARQAFRLVQEGIALISFTDDGEATCETTRPPPPNPRCADIIALGRRSAARRREN
jgi:hypothetical protein